MELTQSDAVFSRTAMVLFLCRNRSSQNDLKINGGTFGKYKKYWQKNQDQGAHTLSTRVGARPTPWACPLPCGPPDAPPTSTLTPYIHFQGEKKYQREGFIAFYDMEPPPSPNLSREG